VTINVPMEVEKVERSRSGNAVAVHGYVGDYGVTIWLSVDEATAAGLVEKGE